jgi:hypothetical protein
MLYRNRIKKAVAWIFTGIKKGGKELAIRKKNSPRTAPPKKNPIEK